MALALDSGWLWWPSEQLAHSRRCKRRAVCHRCSAFTRVCERHVATAVLLLNEHPPSGCELVERATDGGMRWRVLEYAAIIRVYEQRLTLERPRVPREPQMLALRQALERCKSVEEVHDTHLGGGLAAQCVSQRPLVITAPHCPSIVQRLESGPSPNKHGKIMREEVLHARWRLPAPVTTTTTKGYGTTP